MANQNKDAAKKAAELNEERMHPIFDECDVNDFGVVKRHHMLSMNGMYISGITDEQLKEMQETGRTADRGEAYEVLLCRSHNSF